MRNISEFDVLTLPGWQGSGPDHWQTHWEGALPAVRRVHQNDWQQPVYADWSRTLTAAVAACTQPVIIVAHSLANALVARWAQEKGAGQVAGSFMVAPSDIGRFVGTPQLVATGFDPLVLERLPFPAVVLASRNDERVALAHARHFAMCWGADFMDVGNLGHIGSAAKLGVWPQGLICLGQFIATLKP